VAGGTGKIAVLRTVLRRQCGPGAGHSAGDQETAWTEIGQQRIAGILREQLRAERVERLNVAREKLASNQIPAMTAEESQAEIDAYRLEQRGAAGSW
jgi:hypothetical protein